MNSESGYTTTFFGEPHHQFDTVESTLDIARELAISGAASGTLITANHQESGRGRRSAQWIDLPGESALMTYIYRPQSSLINSKSWTISFFSSLAVVKGLHNLGLTTAKVKWPNDIVLNGCKLGGILIESVVDQNSDRCYLIGIGINVAQDQFVNSAEYVLTPISIKIAFSIDQIDKSIPTVSDVIHSVSNSFTSSIAEFEHNPDLIVEDWRSFQMTGHQQHGISIDGINPVFGEYVDIRNSDGAGLIRMDNGEIVAVFPVYST